MILIDNRNYLRINNRSLLERLANQENNISHAIIESSKKVMPTMKLLVEGRPQYLHSKYDPEGEEARRQQQLDIPQQTKHIIFIGAGLGYHIQSFLNKYPGVTYSIYEPNSEVLVQFLSTINLKDLSINRLQRIFNCTNKEEIQLEIKQLCQLADNHTYVYTLPVYNKIYENEVNLVMQTIREQLKDIVSSVSTNTAFQKRWTVNAMKNFSYVIQTPNILHDVDKSVFEGKAAILVAAGPSLSEEFENLRYIKEHGLAYIFSVGSAINALIEHDIYPDAACTYDPTEKNQIVFQKLKELDIKEIPMIFGSSVGFETLENYPGPMLHMITSQDTVFPKIINLQDQLKVVLDAPSIAVVTFQLLKMLGCQQIILVGQDLGFQRNIRYADGIEYDHVNNELSEKEKEKLITVKDVYGNEILTDDVFNKMREQLEMYIAAFSALEVINTSKGGVHIVGTKFMGLKEVIENKLVQQKVVASNWYQVENQYDVVAIEKAIKRMSLFRKKCDQLFTNTLAKLKAIHLSVENHQVNTLSKQINQFDDEFQKLEKNLFYQAFIKPTVRVHNQRLFEKSKDIRYVKDPLKKGEMVVEAFGSYILGSYAHFQFIQPYYQELQERIESLN